MNRIQQMVAKLNSVSNQGVMTPSRQGVPLRATKTFEEIKADLLAKLVNQFDFSSIRGVPPDSLRAEVRRLIEFHCDTEYPLLNRQEREKLIVEVVVEAVGFGPIDMLVRDPSIREVFVYGPGIVCINRGYGLEQTMVKFADETHVRNLLERLSIWMFGEALVNVGSAFSVQLTERERLHAIVPPIPMGLAAVVVFQRM